MSTLAPPSSESAGPAATAYEILRPAIMLWLATQVAMGIVGQIWAFTWRPGSSDLDPFFVGLYELGYLVFAVIVLWFVWPDRQARRIFVRPRPRMAELCILVGVASSLLLSMWERRMPSDLLAGSPIAMEYEFGMAWWTCLLASAFAPAVIEELMYRGLLLQRFLRVMPLGVAIAVQAMLFSLMHYSQVFLLPHFVFGVVAGVLRMAAGALWPCVLMHFLWNGHIVLWQYGLL